ncbi:hypothetical protein QJS04_geneDACA019212 [Acorus gramineus]|uniref:F-box/LRR-repeat protein 15-like leucin rich repeat domain-containing protein n=1 Tax=Acorus gramineus TaxID=55184 RepID=A0AAV8ZX13_ACOGR|nr:hypothetical protein QJS04_geneDACA019212 [Acorus gramineus]
MSSSKVTNSEEGPPRGVCINDALTDDELRAILSRLPGDADRDVFGLVCKRWLRVQSSDRRRLCVRAGSSMLRRMADRFTGIVELDLSQSASRSYYPGVTDSDLSIIAGGFRQLRILKLQNCKGITDAGLIALASGLPSLQSLDVTNCRKLTNRGLVAIAERCCKLKSLNLTDCRSITDMLLETLSKSCSHLEELGLSGCSNITDSGLSVLVDGCHHIKLLDVSKCSKIGDIGVSKVAKTCNSSLNTLKLLDCHKIGDVSIYSLSASCPNLDTLVIGGCQNISDESIKSLVHSCSESLRQLRMDWCLNISDSSLSCVFSKCRNLAALDISCCDRVTDATFLGLKRAGYRSSLKVLRASNCPRITVSAISLILEFCESLEHLDVRSCPQITEVSCSEAGLQFPEGCKINFNGTLTEANVMVDVFF